jgi:hypothetical protein
MSSTPALAPDAAMALGLASTALPFARTPEAEVERWLRVLRVHGQVGIVLQALGVSEEPLTDGETAERQHARETDRLGAGEDAAGEDGERDPRERDAVALVTERALRVAWERHARALATTDVLMAVIDVYGEDFDRVLQARGADRGELLQRLGLTPPLAAISPS